MLETSAGHGNTIKVLSPEKDFYEPHILGTMSWPTALQFLHQPMLVATPSKNYEIVAQLIPK